MKHVATAMSKAGGPCKDCHKHIEQGESIFKFPKEGATRKGQRNGPGVWVCFDCCVRREGYEPSLETVSGTQEGLFTENQVDFMVEERERAGLE